MEILAHRGASGYLPEHTLPAYALAYGQGAGWIEHRRLDEGGYWKLP